MPAVLMHAASAHFLGDSGSAGEFFLVRQLREGGIRPVAIRLAQEWRQAVTLNMRRGWQSGELKGRRIDIQQFNNAVRNAGRDSSSTDDEGHAQRLLQQCHFRPQPEFVEVKSIVAHEDDNGVLPQLQLVECVERESALGIDEGNAVGVGGTGGERLLVSDRGLACSPNKSKLGLSAVDGR